MTDPQATAPRWVYILDEDGQRVFRDTQTEEDFYLDDIDEMNGLAEVLNNLEAKAALADERLTQINVLKSELMESQFQTGVRDIAGNDLAIALAKHHRLRPDHHGPCDICDRGDALDAAEEKP